MIFQIAAAVILIVFYGMYLGKKLQQRRQGIQTDLLGKGKTGFVLFIEISLKVMSFVILIAELFAIFLNASTAPVFVRIIGIFFGVAGDIVFILAFLTMRDSWRAGVPQNEKTELITDGIYQYSRNPAFLAFDMLYIGILLMFFRWWLLLITIITILIFHFQIVNVEEDFLLATFGEKYLAYKKKVNRYWGRRR